MSTALGVVKTFPNSLNNLKKIQQHSKHSRLVLGTMTFSRQVSCLGVAMSLLLGAACCRSTLDWVKKEIDTRSLQA